MGRGGGCNSGCVQVVVLWVHGDSGSVVALRAEGSYSLVRRIPACLRESTPLISVICLCLSVCLCVCVCAAHLKKGVATVASQK